MDVSGSDRDGAPTALDAVTTPLRALVVDDDPGIRAVLVDVLTERGHEVVACPDGESAWEAARRETFGLVLLDLGLPDMDGLELCRRLRGLPHGNRSVVVILTARIDHFGEALVAGADDYLAKPFDLAYLERRLGIAERQLAVLQERATATEVANRLATLMESSFDAIVGLAIDGTITSWNPGAERLYGYSPAEALARPIAILAPPALADEALGLLARTARGELVDHYETEGRAKDGRRLQVSFTVAPVRDVADQVAGAVLVSRDVTERKELEKARERDHRFLSAVLEQTEDGIVACGPDGVLTLFNRATRDFHGLPAEPIPAELWAEHYHLYRADGVTPLPTEEVPLARALRGEVVRDVEFVIAPPGAASRTVRASGRPLAGAGGEKLGAVVSMHDVTQRKAAEAARQVVEAAWSRSFDALPDHLCILDSAGKILQANRCMRDAFEPVHGDLVGLDYRVCYCGTATPDVQPPCVAVLDSGPPVTTEMQLPTMPGWYFVAGYPIDIDGERQGAISVVRDITDRKRAEEALAHQALHDPLTDLPNRRLFGDSLALAMASATSGGGGMAVLLLDLDRFKVVNDSLGHAAGDNLLVMAGRRLLRALRSGATLARFMGDEFVILLEDVESPAEAVAAAERLIAVMRVPFTVAGQHVFVGATVGVAYLEGTMVDHRELVRQADAAMHRAKFSSRGGVAVYDAMMGQQAVDRQALETDLRRALEQGELVVHYQPQVELATGRILGAEALVRWLHPVRGLVPPDDFLPLAEETGLIGRIDALVLGEACRQVARWQSHRLSDPRLRIGVNLSAQRLATADIVDEVASILAETGLAASRLQLEITESTLVEHSEALLADLIALRAIGVRLAIDDFGTGYSSLGYLARLPVNALKIDRSFVHELGDNERMATVVRAIRALARGLNLDIVAEGIETAQQVRLLRDLQVETGQGHYFAKPMPVADIEALLRHSG